MPSFDNRGLDSLLDSRANKKIGRHQASVLGAGDLLAQKMKAGESFGSAFLKDSIASGREFEARGEALRGKHEANVGNISGRINRINAGANLAAQRDGSAQFSGPRGFSRQLEQATKRGKARQGINQRGEKAVQNQQLKDRIGLARQSIKRRGQLQQSSADAARLRSGSEAFARDQNAGVSAAFAGAAGSIAGGALRGFGDGLFDTGDLNSGLRDQQNDVDSFLGADEGFGGVDNVFNSGGNGSMFA